MKKGSSRIKVSNREACAYVCLRRKGLSITTISKAFGRATSVVHRRIKRNIPFETPAFRFLDKRKFPNRIRRLRAGFEWRSMLRLLPKWESFILGESERPP